MWKVLIKERDVFEGKHPSLSEVSDLTFFKQCKLEPKTNKVDPSSLETDETRVSRMSDMRD
jgi:hypothetical protein